MKTYDEIKELIVNRYGDSDEDLAELEIVVDWMDAAKNAVERATSAEDRVAEIDKEWRERYRARFEENVEEHEIEHENADEDISIDEFVEKMRKEDE